MMKPYYLDIHNTIFNQNFLDNELPAESVQMVVTSPPYWGLRKYSGEQDLIWGIKTNPDGTHELCEHEWQQYKRPPGGGHPSESARVGATKADVQRVFDGQGAWCSLCGAWRGSFGLEPTPEMYVDHTIEILREIWRLLRKDGVVFWNIGDSYANDNKWGGQSGGKNSTSAAGGYPRERTHTGLKPKDLCLIPFRIATAAQDDGWWVRSVIIWSKPNPMPESVTDRPTESHEYILMLTKSARYYWDQEAVREQSISTSFGADQRDTSITHGIGGGNSGINEAKRRAREAGTFGSRNLRSVWTFPTMPYPEAHFAVFPEKLPELCIKAATPEVGSCSKCGAPWKRVIEKVKDVPDSWHDSRFDDGKNLINHPDVQRREDAKTNTAYGVNSTAGRLALLRQQSRESGAEYVNKTKTIDWKPSCKCNADKVPSIVLDPFAGAGTTLWVAKKLNRKGIGFDISEEYCKLAVDRIRQQVML